MKRIPLSEDNGPRNDVDPHYGRCGWVLGSFGLRACSVGAGSSHDLLGVRIVSSFFGLHLAEFATREIIVPELGPVLFANADCA